jgi:putative oxidoreductase
MVVISCLAQAPRQNGADNRGIFMSDTTAPRHYVPAFAGIYSTFEPLSLPFLRLVMGLILVPHGCQKLFGWFGGAGFEKFTGMFDKMGWYPAAFWVAVVALTETVGGLMLAFGFLTRFAAAAILIFMLNAIWATGNRGGFFWSSGGLEYSLLIGVVALVFLIRGGGRYSIDHALGREL